MCNASWPAPFKKNILKCRLIMKDSDLSTRVMLYSLRLMLSEVNVVENVELSLRANI